MYDDIFEALEHDLRSSQFTTERDVLNRDYERIDPMASERFKQVLALSLFYRFLATSVEWLGGNLGSEESPQFLFNDNCRNASADLFLDSPSTTYTSSGAQAWTTVKGHIQTSLDSKAGPHKIVPGAVRSPVGDPVPHRTAM